MSKILLVFDYFKEAFHVNKQNKALYAPQAALIAIKVLIIVIMGIGLYNWMGIENINSLSFMQPQEILSFVLNQGLKVLLAILAYAFISVVVEAGLLNMYKKAVTQNYTDRSDFMEGVSKYFLRLFAGELLILLCYIVASPFYIIIGLLSVTVGFAVLPILAAIFLSMWKVSLVMKDNGIFGAIGDSFSFAKKNFIPLALLQVIHFAFSQGPAASGGSGSNINLPNNTGNMTGDPFFGQPDLQQGIEQVIKVFKIVIAILIPIAAAATIGASIISMIFEVFFMLALFVAYKNGFKAEEPVPETAGAEVASHMLPEEPSDAISEESTEEEQNIGDEYSETSNNEEVEQ